MANMINIEHARIRYLNFSGKPDEFNAQGRRTFCLFIDDDLADILARDGWNVKRTRPKSEDVDPEAYIQIRVNYNSPMPPKIYMISGANKVLLNEETVGELDYSQIQDVDVQISPYEWSVRGNSGITAYVKTMYVTVVEDPFASKYSFDD